MMFVNFASFLLRAISMNSFLLCIDFLKKLFNAIYNSFVNLTDHTGLFFSYFILLGGLFFFFKINQIEFLNLFALNTRLFLIFTYNIEEIGSEKIIALLDNARNEPRDLYDIWYLSYNKFIIIYELKSIIEKKCEFRKIHLSNIMKNLELKKSRLRKTWQSRLENQILYLPEFETVYRYVKRELRQTKWNK